MFGSLRYQNPVVRQHLASQYAMGLLTPLVKRRVEALMVHDPGFEKEVRQWQEHLSPLNDLPRPVSVPAHVRDNLLAAIAEPRQTVADGAQALSWWQRLVASLRLWQGLAAGSFAALMLVFLIGFNTPSTVINASDRIAYIAVMQDTNTGLEAPMVITAYAKTDDVPSRIEIRWNERTAQENVDGKTLWAVERNTGATTKLASLAAGSNKIALTKAQWLMVQNSLELYVTDGDNASDKVLLRGTCIRLMNWG